MQDHAESVYRSSEKKSWLLDDGGVEDRAVVVMSVSRLCRGVLLLCSLTGCDMCVMRVMCDM
jgi:hypothetical protein